MNPAYVVIGLFCQYKDCKEQHPVTEERVTCPTCRNDLGLPVLSQWLVTFLNCEETRCQAIVWGLDEKDAKYVATYLIDETIHIEQAEQLEDGKDNEEVYARKACL